MTDNNTNEKSNREMPDVVYAWMGLQDNGSWDAIENVCTPPTTKYIKAPEPIEGLEEVLEKPILGCRDLTSEDEQTINSLYQAAQAYAKLMKKG